MSTKSGRNPILASSNRSTYVLGALALLVVAVVVIGGVVWQSNRNQTRNEGYGSVSNPDVTAALQADGSVLLERAERHDHRRHLRGPAVPVLRATRADLRPGTRAGDGRGPDCGALPHARLPQRRLGER